MEQYFFSNRSELILYDLLTNYIGKQSGRNISKYPQVKNILQNSIRNVYSLKNTFPEMRSNITDKEKIAFLQKKVLRRCIPHIMGHMENADKKRMEHMTNPSHNNNVQKGE